MPSHSARAEHLTLKAALKGALTLAKRGQSPFSDQYMAAGILTADAVNKHRERLHRLWNRKETLPFKNR